jgi:uncharacterized protein
MLIDSLYKDVNDNDIFNDKNNFYLGKVCYVSNDFCKVQVENLSIFNFRKNKSKNLLPNTINFMVIIDSKNGIFIGRVYESKIRANDTVHKELNQNEDNQVYPEINVNIKGIIRSNNQFILPGFKSVGVTDKVYIASDKAINKYWQSLDVRFNELSNKKNKIKDFAYLADSTDTLSINIDSLFDRHLLVVGSTNSGKSTTSLSILEKILDINGKFLLIDPTGEYRYSFSSNNKLKKVVLSDKTENSKTTSIVKIDSSEMGIDDWCTLFGANTNTQPAVLMNAISSLKNNNGKLLKKIDECTDTISEILNDTENNSNNINIRDLPEQIKQESVKVQKKKYVLDEFKYSTNLYLIDKVSTVVNNYHICNYFKNQENNESKDDNSSLLEYIESFCSDDTSLYIDASDVNLDDSFGTFIINLISKKILSHKNKIKDNPFVMFIDEAHRYMQSEFRNRNLLSIGREGRKSGIFLFLSTQRPTDIPAELLSQIGTFIVHRLSHEQDINVMSNFIRKESVQSLHRLGAGEAILSGLNILGDIPIKIKKSSLKHDNSTPHLIQKDK